MLIFKNIWIKKEPGMLEKCMSNNLFNGINKNNNILSNQFTQIVHI